MRISRTILIAALLVCVTASLLPALEQERSNGTARTKSAGEVRQERRLGGYTLGISEERVKRSLGAMHEIAKAGVSVAGNWSVWIDQKAGTLKGISYEERKGIRRGQAYPATGKGITIGSTDEEVVRAYGRPEQALVGKTSFVLRNSELAYIFVYPSQGVWITLTNQKPYAATADWRVTLIAIGDFEVIDTMLHGASSFAMLPITAERIKFTRAEYKKKFGDDKDLEIYDDYQFNRQKALFEHVRTKGKYMILPAMVIPLDGKKAEELASELAPASPRVQAMDAAARKKTLARYGVPSVRLDEILQNVGKLRPILFQKDVEENNQVVMKGLQQKNTTERK